MRPVRIAQLPDSQRGVVKIEQLNIVGKRSGTGFISHKAMLVNALTMALSERVNLLDMSLGRKGFVGYLKALGGSNTVKVTPNGGASGSQAKVKGLKVVCGSNTGHVLDGDWIGEKSPLSFCEVRVSPANSVKPNVGSVELAEALSRVLPFTANEDNRPVLQAVLFKAGEGKLTMVSANGFTLAKVSLDFEGEWQALIHQDDLQGIASALKRARRASLTFEAGDVNQPDTVILDTELIRYKWLSVGGNYPDYEKLIPKEASTVASFDTGEAIKAVGSLKALTGDKDYAIVINLDNGYMTLSNPDDKGQVAIPAEVSGKANRIMLSGGYLAQAFKACGGLVDFKLTDSHSPTLFSIDGYQLVVMPMALPKSQQTEPEAEPEAEAVAEKPKASGKKEKVAVA